MTQLVWDVYHCKCGGEAAMGIMSLIAKCDKCPRVYASGQYARGWFSSREEANQVEADHGNRRRSE